MKIQFIAVKNRRPIEKIMTGASAVSLISFSLKQLGDVASLQAMSHRYLCHESQPKTGVSEAPLSRASAGCARRNARKVAKRIMMI